MLISDIIKYFYNETNLKDYKYIMFFSNGLFKPYVAALFASKLTETLKTCKNTWFITGTTSIINHSTIAYVYVYFEKKQLLFLKYKKMLQIAKGKKLTLLKCFF